MDTIVTPHIRETGLQAVKKAGAVLKEGFGKAHTITYKGQIDLVTEIDVLAEEEAVSLLRSEFPGHGVLAEERAEQNTGAAYRWILDPLDGTTNYAHGYPCFCVSLALEHMGALVWAAVYDPMREELFEAGQSRGARLNGRPIRVSDTDSLEASMLCTGFPYDVRESLDDNIDFFKRFVKVARAIRRDGSAALDLCYVAMGRFDGFWEMKLHPWDLAAGCLIVQEAGGAVTDFSGAPIDLSRGSVVASNGSVHDDMVRILAQGKGRER